MYNTGYRTITVNYAWREKKWRKPIVLGACMSPFLLILHKYGRLESGGRYISVEAPSLSRYKRSNKTKSITLTTLWETERVLYVNGRVESRWIKFRTTQMYGCTSTNWVNAFVASIKYASLSLFVPISKIRLTSGTIAGIAQKC